MSKTLSGEEVANQSSTFDQIQLTNGSETITLDPSALTTSYNFTFPSVLGASGQVLTSQGIGLPLHWATSSGGSVTSVTATVPSFLQVTSAPITSTGAIAIDYDPSNPLPVLYGGTGTNSATGTGPVVLANSPLLTNPTLGAATATTLLATSQVQTPHSLITGTTSGTITIQGQAVAGTYNFNLPTTAGTTGQVLTSQGGTTNAMTWSNASTGTVTSVAASVPSFLSIYHLRNASNHILWYSTPSR
jgi:hypothetical protein